MNLTIILVAAIIFNCYLNLIQVSGQRDFNETLISGARVTAFYLVPLGLLLFIRRDALKLRLLTVLDLVTVSTVGSLISTLFSIYNNLLSDWDYVGLHQNQLYRRHIQPQITFFFMDAIVFCAFSLAAKMVASVLVGVRNRSENVN